MWLTTPRFLAGLGLLATAMAAIAWAQGEGAIGQGAAKACYAAGALCVMVAIAFRARARWPRGADR